MLQKALVPLVLAAACVAIPAQASEAIVKKARCVSCHAVDKKMVGPAFKDIAAKYAGQKDAAAKLADTVIKGGTGVWGQIPMPANAVSKDEADKLVAWVLATKK